MSVGEPHDLAQEEEAHGDLIGEIEPGEVTTRKPGQLFWLRLKRDRVAMVALAAIIGLILVAISAPLIIEIVGTPDPNVPQPDGKDESGLPKGPEQGHPFGFDNDSRDVFSRVVFGSRASLQVALVATAASVIFGTAVGLVAGFYRGWRDNILARVMDVMLAFPVLLLALGISSACAIGNGCLGGTIKPGITLVITIIAIAGWPYVARIIRGQVLSLREKEFVEASRSLGASNARIMLRDILPNLLVPIIVYSTLLIPTNILFEAALSFLGVGIPPPDASWGSMIAEASKIFQDAWWFMLFPGLALLITVLAFNLLGDGLQDALNPKGQK